jgi:hypothetical protein
LHAGFQQIVAMDTTNAQHTYRVDIPANSSTFDVFVDGAHQFTGQAALAPHADTTLWWGDTTPSGGRDFVRFTN